MVDSIPTCMHALGVIRKSDGSIRPITVCKCPIGVSINNFMDSVCESFSYVSFDQVCSVMSADCFMSVLDIKSAYRSVNIFPDHRQYQGFLWDVSGCGIDQTMVDNCLCFGLKSAPYLYTQITEFVMRTMSQLGFPGVFGYLDDFIAVSPTELQCKKVMSVLIDVLQCLGFVGAWKKVVPPCQSVTYLGILLDSVSMTLSLPAPKVVKLKKIISSYDGKTFASLKDLQVLAGYLSHASTVVRGGRTFSRINLLKFTSGSSEVCRLPDWFREDLCWWLHFIEYFNGQAKIISDIRELEVVRAFTNSIAEKIPFQMVQTILKYS